VRAHDTFRRFIKNKFAVIALFILVVEIAATAFSPWLVPYRATKTAVGRPFQAPNSVHLMGTDDLGRDIYSGVLSGLRVSLLVGVVASITASVIGVFVGSVSGYYGGLVDAILLKFIEFFQCIPRLLLALVIVVLFGNSIWNIVLVIGLLSWPRPARMVRAEFLRLKEQDFMLAAKAIGKSNKNILLTELLPNALYVIIVNGSLEVGAAILIEAGLSFLGLGDPNIMSWGKLLFNAQRFLRRAWWMGFFPGFAIFLTVLCLNFVGDAVNDALNPRLRGR